MCRGSSTIVLKATVKKLWKKMAFPLTAPGIVNGIELSHEKADRSLDFVVLDYVYDYWSSHERI